jgi:hypothetical protein
VATVDEIPESIIANNIFGIDIDLRAVQLSALTLLLKARTLNKECAFSDRNLACANVEAITGGKLETFIAHSEFSHPIYERILRGIVHGLKDSEQLGSLLRLEKTLEDLIAGERITVEAKRQLQISFPGLTPEQFTTREGVQEFFEILYEQILRHLDDFVRKSRSRDLDPSHFATETEKGLRFLGIVSSKYDVVATNPPYLSGRKMNKRLVELLKDQYPEGKSDLYAAFIIRCQELARQQGFIGMLTMHSFMFISSYEPLRDTLRQNVCVETLAHFGGGLFAVGNPGTLQTAAHVLRKEPDLEKRQEHQGTYFRLAREKDSEAKRIAFEDARSALRAGQPHPLVFTCRQEDFDAVPGKPWVYWLSEKVRQLFLSLGILGETAPSRKGLATADNTRFLRKWWEIGIRNFERNASSCAHSQTIGMKWFPYMKGGTPKAWFGNQEHVLNWGKNGAEIDAFRPRAVIRNPTYYFRRGVTWEK